MEPLEECVPVGYSPDFVRISLHDVSGVTIVNVTGRLTLGQGSSCLRDTVRNLLDTGRKQILINLAGVSLIDSSGIGNLISSLTDVNRAGGRLKLLNLTRRVKDLLQITKLFDLFEVYVDVAEALRSYL